MRIRGSIWMSMDRKKVEEEEVMRRIVMLVAIKISSYTRDTRMLGTREDMDREGVSDRQYKTRVISTRVKGIIRGGTEQERERGEKVGV